MTPINEPISDQAFHKLLAIMRLARQHSRQLADEQGLRPQEHSVLRYLMENGDATIGQMQQYLHKSPSTTSALMAKLENAGLVTRQRSVEDNRVVVVTLTPQGRERTQNTPLAGYPLLRRQLGTLSEARQIAINDVLTEILELMGGQDDL
jgi:DNA-binding MarR family transcriptional regulator